jgi:hypothetical protein
LTISYIYETIINEITRIRILHLPKTSDDFTKLFL